MVEIFFFLPVEVYFCFVSPFSPNIYYYKVIPCCFSPNVPWFGALSVGIEHKHTFPEHHVVWSVGAHFTTLRNFYFCKYIYRAAVFVFGLCKISTFSVAARSRFRSLLNIYPTIWDKNYPRMNLGWLVPGKKQEIGCPVQFLSLPRNFQAKVCLCACCYKTTSWHAIFFVTIATSGWIVHLADNNQDRKI